MEKKPYEAPQIVRVQLNPEQAVLSACAVSASTLTSNLNVTCNLAKNCKSYKDASGNSAATS